MEKVAVKFPVLHRYPGDTGFQYELILVVEWLTGCTTVEDRQDPPLGSSPLPPNKTPRIDPASVFFRVCWAMAHVRAHEAEATAAATEALLDYRLNVDEGTLSGWC